MSVCSAASSTGKLLIFIPNGTPRALFRGRGGNAFNHAHHLHRKRNVADQRDVSLMTISHYGLTGVQFHWPATVQTEKHWHANGACHSIECRLDDAPPSFETGSRTGQFSHPRSLSALCRNIMPPPKENIGRAMFRVISSRCWHVKSATRR